MAKTKISYKNSRLSNDDDDDDFGLETETDLSDIPLEVLSQSVVFSTDWTTETLIAQLRKGNIDLDPAFQRRDAWNVRRKSMFIESLILGLPVPQIVLAEKETDKGTFIVIDGKQRLLSLARFTGASPSLEPFVLSSLKIRHDLNGDSYEELRKKKSDLNALENQTIRTVVIRNWKSEDLLYLIFHRLNSETLPLSPQELRQALHPGPFLKFCDEHSLQSEGLKRILKLRKPDFRMRDVELLVRFVSFKNFIQEYKGNLKSFLDRSCKTLNRNWKLKKSLIEEQTNDFEQGVDLAYLIFDGSPFRKWNDEGLAGYEPRFNRAIFDIVMYYFSDPKIRNLLTASGRTKLNRSFKALCLKDEAFIRSVESSTKSKDATTIRFNKWAAILGKAVGKSIMPPKLG